MLARTHTADSKAVVKEYAKELGFDLVRVAPAHDFAEDRAAALERLRAGYMDGLPWFTEARVRRGASPQELLPGARSIICLGLNYYRSGGTGPGTEAAAGKVARYAWGRDYHRLMKNMMRAYTGGLRIRLGARFAARWYVDDGPMLDRAAARRAGLGWFGKSTNILTPSHGSWIFLGQVVTDLDLEADQPLKKTCGSCARCIDACPTGAIISPYVVDNSRCISYLTIENRGPIPEELRPSMGEWVFGCDICQDVCPVNRRAVPSRPDLWERTPIAPCPSPKTGRLSSIPAAPAAPASVKDHAPAGSQLGGGDPWASEKNRLETLDLVGVLAMSEEEFQHRFRGSPILRAKRTGLQRNACVALGNRRDPAAVPALSRVLREGEPLVRRHAAWALGRAGATEARLALERARPGESDSEVLLEIDGALKRMKEGTRTRSQESA